MIKKIFFVALTALVFQAQAQVAETKGYSLKEAVDYAVQNNNSMKNARIGEDQAKARNWEIITTGLPQLSASVDYNYYFKTPVVPALSKFFSDTTSSTYKVFNYLAQGDPNIQNILYQSAVASRDQKISFVLPHSLTGGLQASQLVFDSRYFFGIKATKDLMKTSRLSTQLSEQDVRYNVTKAYYQAQSAKEANALLQSNLELVSKLVKDTRAVYKQGLIEELDVNRLELIEANLQSQINMQNQLAELALNNLKYQMGLALNDNVVLTDNLDELKGNLTLDAGVKFDASQRVEYELLNTAIRLKGYDMAQKRSGYYPSMVAFLSYGWTAQTDKFSDIFKTTKTTYPDGYVQKNSPWYSQGLVGFSLKLPIFDSGMKMAQVKQAKLEQQKSINDLENFKNAADLQFRAAQTTYNTALAEEVNSKRALDLSEKIFKKNQAKFQQGVGSSFELTQSETEYTTNQLKHIQSVLNLLNAKADLDKALGKK